MRQALFATLLAPLVLAATPAGPDLPRRSPPPLDYYSPTPVGDWEGLYPASTAALALAPSPTAAIR